MDTNPLNVFLGCVTGLVAFALLVGAVYKVNVDNNDVRRAKEETEQVRLEGCRSIEDEAVRVLCLAGVTR
jgi:hypothetical protein